MCPCIEYVTINRLYSIAMYTYTVARERMRIVRFSKEKFLNDAWTGEREISYVSLAMICCIHIIIHAYISNTHKYAKIIEGNIYH